MKPQRTTKGSQKSHKGSAFNPGVSGGNNQKGKHYDSGSSGPVQQPYFMGETNPNDLLSWRLAQSFGIPETTSTQPQTVDSEAMINSFQGKGGLAHHLTQVSPHENLAVQDIRLSQILTIPRDKRKEMLHMLVEALDAEEDQENSIPTMSFQEQVPQLLQPQSTEPQSTAQCHSHVAGFQRNFNGPSIPDQSQAERSQPRGQPSRKPNAAQQETLEELRGALRELLKSPQELEAPPGLSPEQCGDPSTNQGTQDRYQHQQKSKHVAQQAEVAKSGGAPKKIDLSSKYSQYKGIITTLMIRNIPLRVTQQTLMQVLADKGFGGQYDFFYMPSGLKPENASGGENTEDSGLEWQSISTSNLGYAFINFPDTEIAMSFQLAFHNYKFETSGSNKRCIIYPAHIQGLENNVKHFRRTAVKLSTNKPFIRYGNSPHLSEWGERSTGPQASMDAAMDVESSTASVSDVTSTSTLNCLSDFASSQSTMTDRHQAFRPHPRTTKTSSKNSKKTRMKDNWEKPVNVDDIFAM